MRFTFDLLEVTRKKTVDILNTLSSEQANKIPQGFNNNIIWNVGHLNSSLYLLTHSLCKLPPGIPMERIDLFKRGTKPGEIISAEGIAKVKEDHVICFEYLKKEYMDGKFQKQSFTEYQTSYGVLLANIDDAITFSIAHEAIHIGVMKTMIKYL